MRFITVALAFFLPGILSGQFVTRTQTTDSVSVRAEGIAELVVDLVQQCTQSRPGAISTPYLTAHIQAFFIHSSAIALSVLPLDPALLWMQSWRSTRIADLRRQARRCGIQKIVPHAQFAHLSLTGINGLTWQQVQIPSPGAFLPRVPELRDALRNASEGDGGPE
jgi:hypothetical protein